MGRYKKSLGQTQTHKFIFNLLPLLKIEIASFNPNSTCSPTFDPYPFFLPTLLLIIIFKVVHFRCQKKGKSDISGILYDKGYLETAKQEG